MLSHESYIQRCLQLASNGMGHTLQNPLVGCVIVKDGIIIGEGFHTAYGEDHAEVAAWKNAGKPSTLSGCTVYVNMEPCSHQGKTPPCTNLLLNLKPSTVVIAQTDPNARVSGRGAEILRNADIEVITGVLESEARFLNRRFNTFHEQKRPYIILKWAQTQDGFVAPLNQPKGHRYIISNPYMHTLVHTWRAQEMSICVGNGTIIFDDPELTVRHVKGNNPIRIILDRQLEIPMDKKVFNTEARTLVFNTIKSEKKDHVEWIKISNENFAAEALQEIYARDIQSVFVEGGPNLFNSLLKSGYWDEMRTITAPKKIGRGIAAPPTTGKIVSEEIFDGDRLEIRVNAL